VIAGEWRKIFLPEEGAIWGTNDYSQQEPRWTTHFAAKLQLPKAEEAARRYRENEKADNHEMMTRLIYGDELVERWMREDPKMFKVHRGYCKNIFLGLCYGEGGAKLCGTLGKPTRFGLFIGYGRDRKVEYFNTRQDAWKRKAEIGGDLREVAGEEGQRILDDFDREVPFVRAVAKAASKKAEDSGFVRTILGRRLHFSTNDQGRYDWTHKALNRVIQGSSADQTKKALVDLDNAGMFIQLQVHDEIDGSYGSVEEAKKVGKIMRESILDVAQPLVPFLVDTEVGPSWGEIKTV
jgi:DNA polymerase I-like protein with 3'-5' exonuclease and polymerase domains